MGPYSTADTGAISAKKAMNTIDPLDYGLGQDNIVYILLIASTCNKVPISLSVRIWPFQGRGPGSIPGWGI